MIRYTLTCREGHSFESWFQSADAYDGLAARSMIGCAICGGTSVTKALMTPSVKADTRRKDEAGPPADLPATPNGVAERIAEMRRHIEENADYVGLSFATEARAMHEGDIPERPIYGEARADEARKLIEDGIPVAPLPFVPKRHAN